MKRSQQFENLMKQKLDIQHFRKMLQPCKILSQHFGKNAIKSA
jgi:hypothetical protein